MLIRVASYIPKATGFFGILVAPINMGRASDVMNMWFWLFFGLFSTTTAKRMSYTNELAQSH